MAAPTRSFFSLFLFLFIASSNTIFHRVEVQGSSTTWCVARSDASQQALQKALDYACGAGADCSPINSNGLCYLPNTIQQHASYAFNSYYQRKSMAPGSCDFAGTATVAATDPSYGSCVYPSSFSSAGGPATPTPSMQVPTTTPLTPSTTLPNVPTTPIMAPPAGYAGNVGGEPYSDASILSRAPSLCIFVILIIHFFCPVISYGGFNCFGFCCLAGE